MDCEKVRDQFSSLLEGDLKPPEEGKVREHLGSCRDCQKEWEEFNRMMGWLHTVEEEEVPEGFLSEVQKKREERKGQERRGGVWSLRSMKIPIQAAAMVMIVFIALYLTKMTPFETLQKGAVEKSEVLQSDIQKKETEPVSPPPINVYPEKYRAEAKPSVADEEKKILSTPPLKEEKATVESLQPKEMVKAEPPPVEEKRRESERVGTIEMPLAKKPRGEMTLKISDREKAISRLQDLANQLGGQIIREDGDVLMVSLPASSYAEFEKEVARIGSPPSAPMVTLRKTIKDDLTLAAGAKSQESISIRIRLVPE